MAIDMSTVKQIMYNNKEVTKIEDGLGNILWQKQAPEQFDPTILYYIDGTSAYKVDMINKTITPYTTIGGVSTINGSKITEYNGKLYATAGYYLNSPNYLVEIDDDNQTITYTLSNVINLNANSAFKIGSNNYAGGQNGRSYQIYNANTNTVKWDFTPATNQIYANGVIKFNNRYLAKRNEDKFAEYNATTDNWINNNMNMPVSNAYPYEFWVWNGILYYSQGSNQYFLNNDTGTSWFGGGAVPIYFNGSRTFTDGTSAYMLGGTGTSNIIYKKRNDSASFYWNSYWTIPYSWRGDFFINKHGSAQLAQNARPKIE